MYKKSGFTLIELALTVSIMSILVITTFVFSIKALHRNDIQLTATNIVHILRKAQYKSIAVAQDSTWGVYLQNDTVVLFSGSSYSSRDNSFDELYILPSSIVLSGLEEVIFEKFDGDTKDTGAVILTNNEGSLTLNIDSKGNIMY